MLSLLQGFYVFIKLFFSPEYASERILIYSASPSPISSWALALASDIIMFTCLSTSFFILFASYSPSALYCSAIFLFRISFSHIRFLHSQQANPASLFYIIHCNAITTKLPCDLIGYNFIEFSSAGKFFVDNTVLLKSAHCIFTVL